MVFRFVVPLWKTLIVQGLFIDVAILLESAIPFWRMVCHLMKWVMMFYFFRNSRWKCFKNDIHIPFFDIWILINSIFGKFCAIVDIATLLFVSFLTSLFVAGLRCRCHLKQASTSEVAFFADEQHASTRSPNFAHHKFTTSSRCKGIGDSKIRKGFENQTKKIYFDKD